MLPQAVEQGVAYVPGGAFFADNSMRNVMRLSFVTVPAEQIDQGIATLARVLREAQDPSIRLAA